MQNNEAEFDKFLDKVNSVSEKINGLASGKLSVEEFDMLQKQEEFN